MLFITIFKNIYTSLPPSFQNPKWIYVIVLLLLSVVHTNWVENQYLIISQKMAMGIEGIAPREIDMLNELCVLNAGGIDGIIYDKAKICVPKVKEFFNGRLGKKNKS